MTLSVLFACLIYKIITAINAINQSDCNHSLTSREMIEHMMHGYDKQAIPVASGMTVMLEIHVQDISSLSELSSDFELDLFYSEIWVDPALSFVNYSLCKSNITLKPFRERIWRPDTCVVNSKKAAIHRSPSENSFVILYEDGTVWVNYRMLIKAPCRMQLAMFPFDIQQCYLIFESYSYNSQEVQLNWYHDPVTMMGPVDLPDFSLERITTEHFRLPYPNGLWDRLRVTFTFSRRYGFYVFQVYFPTSITVISSWIGFYLDIRSTSARITLGVNSLLALTFQFGTVLQHLPRVSYIKCLDVWMIFCVTIVFLTLVELAIISRLTQRDAARELGRQVINRWITQMRQRQVLDAKEAEKQRKASTASSKHHHRKVGAEKEPLLPKAHQKLELELPSYGTISSLAKRRRSEDEMNYRRHLRKNFFLRPLLSPVADESDEVESKEEFKLHESPSGDQQIVMKRSDTPIEEEAPSSCLQAIRERIRTIFEHCRPLLLWRSLSNCTAAQIDAISIIVFPSLFALFSVVYFTYVVCMRFR